MSFRAFSLTDIQNWGSVLNVEKICYRLRKVCTYWESLWRWAKSWESVLNVERECWMWRKCAKSWKRMKKPNKSWESVLKVDKINKKFRKCAKRHERMLKVEKVCNMLRKYVSQKFFWNTQEPKLIFLPILKFLDLWDYFGLQGFAWLALLDQKYSILLCWKRLDIKQFSATMLSALWKILRLAIVSRWRKINMWTWCSLIKQLLTVQMLFMSI